MKTYQKFIAIAMVIFAFSFTTSCKKTIDEIIDDATPSYSCKIDGQNWNAETMAGALSDSGIVVSAFRDSTTFILSIEDFAIGNYPIDISNTAASYTPDGGVDIYLAIDGQIDIKNITTTINTLDIKFNMRLVNLSFDTIVITNGIGSNILYAK